MNDMPSTAQQPSVDSRTQFSATKALGYAARDAASPLTPWSFERRALRPRDVRLDILYTGVCHTVVGLGGLGHLGVKFAHALGCEVVVITTSPGKAEDAKRLGADAVLVSREADAMKAAANSFDLILSTVPVNHDFNPYLTLLKRNATMVMVGVLEPITSPF